MVKLGIILLSACVLLGCKIPHTENKYDCDNGFSTGWGANTFLPHGSNVIRYGDNRYAIPDGVTCTIYTREVTTS